MLPCSHASHLSTTGDSADEKSGREGNGGCVPSTVMYNFKKRPFHLKSKSSHSVPECGFEGLK